MNKLKLLFGILIGLIGVIVLLFLFSGKIKNFFDGGNTDYNFVEDTDYFKKSFENITLMNSNEIKNIKSDNSIYLEVFGENNQIFILPETDIKYAVVRGKNNSLNLCQGIHNPTVMELGQEVKIIYSNC